jgi:cytochrome c biogenesis protein CcdA
MARLGLRIETRRRRPIVNRLSGSVLSLGLLLGLRHALETDHLMAVAALATGQRTRREIVLIACAWDLGHAAVLFVAGVALTCIGVAWPPTVAKTIELVAGAALVALGIDVLRRVRRPRAGPASPVAGTSRALVVGGVHGLEGSGAVVLVVLPSARSPSEALVYLAVFGAGTMLGMLACSAAVSMPVGFAARWLGRGAGVVQLLVGAVSIGVGAVAIAHTLVTAPSRP